STSLTVTSDSVVANKTGTSGSFTVSASTLDHFTFVLATPQIDGVAFTGTNTLTAQDAYSNTVTGFSAAGDNVTITALSPFTGAVSGLHGSNVLNAAGDFSSGVANLTSLGMTYIGNDATGMFKAASADSKAGTSGNVVMNFGSAAQLVITTPPSSTDASGAALSQQPVVKVEDVGGNVVTSNSSTVTAAITTGGVSVTNPTKAASSGVATFSGLALNALAGNYTLTFTDGSLTAAVSNSITVSTGAATQLVVTTAPSGAASGSALTGQPVVKVQDSGGNVVTNASGAITATINTGTGGAITAGASVSISGGVATFTTLTMTGVAGNSYTLHFSNGTFSVNSGSFTMTFGAATQLVITTAPSGAASGSALTGQPVVKVEDSAGNVVTSATGTMTATINSGTGGSITAGATSTISGGVATYSALTMTGVAGNSYTLHFSNSTFSVNSGSFTMTFGTATQLVVTIQPSGAVSGFALAPQPAVQVQDSAGNVVTSASGTMTATINTGTGGAITAGATTTISGGAATYTALTMTGVTGNSYTLHFSNGALSVNSASFTMTPAPTISSPTATSPCNPAHNGTTTCTITGTNFENGATVAISANGSVTGVTWNSSTQITITVTGSGGNGGKGNLTVTNPDGGVATVTDGFKNGS
ncbi:MAG: Mucin-22, partial [Acidimicrobiaceae bacterium]|nr:Mucin-22 [Acidimicrobiaceae bacterium]